MQSYEEYMTQGDSTFRTSYNRPTTYCGIVQKPLQTQRKRFVALVSTFLAVQLAVSIGLVVGVAVKVNAGRSSVFVKRRDCVACDAWCAANCSLLGDAANDQRSLARTFSVNYRQGNTITVMCCIKRRDLLSKIYEANVHDQGETREKLFDGVRVIDRWTEDDPNKWPKSQNPSILYSKPTRTFTIQSDGTYFVHSRIDFSCSNNKYNYYKQTIHVKNDPYLKSFEDNRIDLSKTHPAIRAIYTSSIDVMVKLTKGEQLEMLTDPYNCTSPRSIVFYHLQDV